MRTFGRYLQIVGLVSLPFFMVLELSGTLGRNFGVADLLIALVFGTAVFFLGHLMEGYAGS